MSRSKLPKSADNTLGAILNCMGAKLCDADQLSNTIKNKLLLHSHKLLVITPTASM
jgi:hypothetical protein